MGSDTVRTERRFEVGQKVVLWVGLELMMPGAYGNRKGTVRQFMPDFPGGPSYEVVFDLDSGARTPYVCVKPEWVFPDER